MRYFILISSILWLGVSRAQVYTVNTTDDQVLGVCNAAHCSFREAIIAAEADGVPSTILFNIAGAGQQSINPQNSFPTITQPDLTILGESQAGGPGTIVIDFNNRNFGGISFWDILGSRFYISGIDFADYAYNSLTDHLLQFGDVANNSTDSKIYNCAFQNDFSFLVLGSPQELIRVNSADNLKISNCIFGTDRAMSAIFNFMSYIKIEGTQGNANVTIDSNIFVNSDKAILWAGGKLFVNKNLFGATDTFHNANLLNPKNAIVGATPGQNGLINDNYFFGYQKEAILSIGADNLTISKNRFYDDIQDIQIKGVGNEVNIISDNVARDGRGFLYTDVLGEIDIERNNIANYDTVFYNINDPLNDKIRHIDNKMNCINDKVVVMNSALFPSHAIPTISTVNRNQITGKGNPNDSVVVYSNKRVGCPNAVCQAGNELGRTQADGAGNWVLNAVYPNKSTISAYQFESNPNVRPTLYSEFSPCYVCPGQVKTNFNPSLCAGQTINYHGKIYSSANAQDSFGIAGDGVSICDSVFIVKVDVNNGYRTHIDTSVCFQDTLRFPGNVKIYKNHFDDSLQLKSTAGCDSIITITGREVGVGTLNQTICDNASITVFGTVFDKNNTSGTAVGAGQAVSGCDSIVNVNLTINNFTDFTLNRNMCPGQNLKVGNQTFDAANPKGDATLPGASSTGCDSVVHVNLTYPNNVGTFTTTICKTDSIKIPNTNTYFSVTNPSGQVTITGGSSFGCDSVINVSISTYPDAIGAFSTNLCPGDSFVLDNKSFSDKNPIGQVIRKGSALHGCDSIINVTVNVIPNAMSVYKADFCRGDTVVLGTKKEQFYSGKITGIIRENNSAANGCDSLVDVQLTEIPQAIGNFDTVMCENQTRTIFGEVFSINRQKDDLRIPHASSRMCDSFIHVNIKFNPETMGNFTKTICRKDAVKVGNQTFDANNLTGAVRLVGGNSSGCDSVINVSLTLNPEIQLNFNANDLKCNQANTGELVLTDITGGSGNFQVSIDNKAPINYTKGDIIGNLSQGSHTVRIIDQLSCDTSYNFTINNSQVLALTLPNDTTIKKGSIVDVIANINFIQSSIKWDPDTYLTCNNCLNPQAVPDQTVTYTLTVTDENGCTVSDNITITVIIDKADIYVPNVFSPNGDNINDLFMPVFKFPEKTTITVFRIFDRWGNLLFEKLDGQLGEVITWDGKKNQEKMNPGVYVYAIQFMGEDKVAKWKTGDITLIR